jgi:hypothetical protein
MTTTGLSGRNGRLSREAGGTVHAYMHLLDIYPLIACCLQSGGSAVWGVGHAISGSPVGNSKSLLDSAEHGVMICLFDRHTSNHNTRHPNIPLHIWSPITSLKDLMFNNAPPHLECVRLAKVPSHHACSHSLILSFLTKSSGPYYLPSPSLSFIASATP